MESIGRAERIAEKLQRGLLPRAKLVKTWAGFGKGRPCDGCDQAILSADIEQELDFEDSRTLRLHDACAVVWRRETGVRHTESGMTGARAVPPFGVSDEQVRLLLAAIVESSDDAIVSKTIDGVITSWNGGAERMLGWPAEMAIGSHITLIVPEERRAEEDEVLARIRRGERIHHFDTVRVTRDGRLIDVSLTVSPVLDAAGRIVGASKVAATCQSGDDWTTTATRSLHRSSRPGPPQRPSFEQRTSCWPRSHMSCAHRSTRSLGGPDC
jgi:PAS domain S-box-containing protein